MRNLISVLKHSIRIDSRYEYHHNHVDKKYYKRSKDIRREHDADISYIQALFYSKNENDAFVKLTKLQKENITLDQQRKIHALVGEYYFTKNIAMPLRIGMNNHLK